MISLKNSCQDTRLSVLCAGLTTILALTSARAEQVIFTEINYNPAGGKPEFVEITNNTATPFDMGKWYFSDGINYTFPDFNSADTDAHILKHWERIVVTNVTEATFRAAYPSTPAGVRVFGPYTGALSNSGENVALSDKNGVVMAELDYNDGGKWPASADGAGHTITRINPNRARGEWRNWRASNTPGGTPGEDANTPSQQFLTISEVHFDIDGNVDWIELHSPINTIPVTAFSLAADRQLATAVPLTGTIPAGGYQSFAVNFTPDLNGDLDLFLAVTATGIIMDAAKLDRDNNEESFQLFPVGGEFYGGPGHTRDAPNDPANRNEDIVINEIMFDAPSDHLNGEFIELYNRSSDAINLTGWKFTQGIGFDFPDGTVIGGNSYLVIAADSDCLLAAHGAINVIGNWSGTLRDSGELIRLVDNNGNMADEVDYLPGGDWPNLADGDGSSMELRHPDMDNNVVTAWTDSSESNKSSMQAFSYTADYIDVPWPNINSIDKQELHAHLVGDGHIILENIALKLNNSGANLVKNSNLMSSTSSSASGWVCQGTHWASFMDNGKLNLIADGHGDNKANRAEVDLVDGALHPSNPNNFNTSHTLTFDARWVSGKPRVIFQTLDHGFGASFLLPIPENLGTPGAPNSALLPSAAPTVAKVIHSPAVPKSGNPVTVSARIDSAGPLTSVEAVYRLDNSNGNGAWQRRAMTDDGTGLYSVDLTQYTSNGNVVQFYVEAIAGGESTFQPIYGPNRPAMWIVDNRTMPSVLLRERFVVSAYDRRALTSDNSNGAGAAFGYNFPRMSNHFFNATFIANESEIYYNAEIRKSGSPFTRSTNDNISHGKWKLPGDRLFRNRRRSVIDPSGTFNDDNTPRYYDDRIARYFLYQLGHPINEFEFVHSVINTDGFRLRENHEPISNDFLNRNFKDGTDGTLFRIDDEWFFNNDDGNSRSSRNADWSYKKFRNEDNDLVGINNPTNYQSEWIMRTRESDHDLSTYIEFVRTLDGTFDESEANRMANARMLGLNAAVRGYDADWDTITVDRGKNAYMYRPKDGSGFMLLHWDGDRVFEQSTRAIIGGRAGVSKYFAQPYVRRYVNYYLTKLLDEHTKGSARTEAWMDAETSAVSGSGVIMPKSHYTNWFNIRETFSRNFVTGTVNNTPFAITTSNANTTDDILALAGTSPPTVLDLRVVGRPDAIVHWTDKTQWTIDGLILAEGSNVFDVEGIDHDGNVIETAQFTITKTNNAPPIVLVDTLPKSLNLGVGETITFDASTSFDPEGDLLSIDWSVSPAYGANLIPNGNLAEATFSIPGLFVFTASATDSEPETTVKEIAVSVHGDGSFSTFGNTLLEAPWTLASVEKHGNSSSGPHYSMQDNDGRLTINIPLGLTPLGLPPVEVPAPVQYLDFGDVWKYDDSGAELTIGGVFAQPGFDDNAWLSGPGFLGRGESGLPTPGLQTGTLQRGNSTNGLITYYFRKEFEFSGDPVGAQLYIDQIVDDGVRYYLNGQVIGNVRLPEGNIDSNTPGTKLPVEDTIEPDALIADVSGSIINGTNVLAAEVHNESTGSSDVVFGVRVDIAANEESGGAIDLDDAIHPWIKRPLPAGDWTLQTEVKLEKAQFGQFYAGLLVEADQGGNPFRYGVGYKNGTHVASMRVNPSGSSETMVEGPEIDSNILTVRLQRTGDDLIFSWRDGSSFSPFHTVSLPAGTTFSVGGVFASTEMTQSLEASFDYAMLIEESTDFAAWMEAGGFTDANAEYDDTGLSNLMAYALGRDLSDIVEPSVNADGGTVTFTHRQRIPVSNLDYRVESSTNLIDWTPAGDLAPSGAATQNPGGTWTVNLESNLTPVEQPEIYYRLVVMLPQ
ncbi:lamin tail domain-containing protein [Akkermansiaceae bacterium]|nr:lamin tail domain-containing protein [Akkermansiaceae bacterium]